MELNYIRKVPYSGAHHHKGKSATLSKASFWPVLVLCVHNQSRTLSNFLHAFTRGSIIGSCFAQTSQNWWRDWPTPQTHSAVLFLGKQLIIFSHKKKLVRFCFHSANLTNFANFLGKTRQITDITKMKEKKHCLSSMSLHTFFV